MHQDLRSVSFTMNVMAEDTRETEATNFNSPLPTLNKPKSTIMGAFSNNSQKEEVNFYPNLGLYYDVIAS